MKLHIIMTLGLLLCNLSPAISEENPSAEEAFSRIYADGVWGRNAQGEGISGGGSNVEAAREYMNFLQKFLKEHHIRSVVELGCGDWEFSQHVDWSGITYRGYDVVRSVIERNHKKFSTSTITFIQGDATQIDLPSADLLICKDVMQHITNEDVLIMCAQFPKFKYCLITNDALPDTVLNPNDKLNTRGGHRTLDLSRPPFNIQGKKVLTFQTETLKQTFLVSRGKKRKKANSAMH
jgi:hypothetical protein